MTEKKKLKVFYVTARGASARSFLLPHFRVFMEEGYELYLACSDDKEAKDAVERSGIKFLPIPLKSTISPASDIRAIVRLCLLIRKHRPDVVHGHMSKAGLVSMLSAYFSRVTVRIYHNHGMACFSSTGMKKYLLSAVERLACLLATNVIFCSESTRDLAVSKGLCCSNKAVVLGGGTISGINTDVFSPEGASKQSAQFLNELPEGLNEKKFVSFVGRLVPHKGVITLLAAWKLVSAETKKNYSLLIAGANEGDSIYRKMTNMAEKDGSLIYLGRIDNILGLYGVTKILVLPSWHEGFPYSVLEAQSCGVPAIVTDVTGNRDAVDNNSTGLLVEVDDAHALAESIEKLLHDEKQLEEMALNARQSVLAGYDEEKVLSNLMEFYKNGLFIKRLS